MNALLFPISVSLTAEKVVIVGAGEIGYHKTLNLIKFGLKPHVIGEQVHPNFKDIVEAGKATVEQKTVEWSDLHTAFLIILVTNDESTNDRFASKAKQAGKLVVHASNPSLGNAQIPATLVRGKLLFSVSTSGASPTLAKQIRDKLATDYTGDYEAYLDFLATVRLIVKQKFEHRSERKKWLQAAVQPTHLEDELSRVKFMQELNEC